MSEITILIEVVQAGDPLAASQLLPLIYDHSRRLAARRLTQAAPAQALQPAANGNGTVHLLRVGEGSKVSIRSDQIEQYLPRLRLNANHDVKEKQR